MLHIKKDIDLLKKPELDVFFHARQNLLHFVLFDNFRSWNLWRFTKVPLAQIIEYQTFLLEGFYKDFISERMSRMTSGSIRATFAIIRLLKSAGKKSQKRYRLATTASRPLCIIFIVADNFTESHHWVYVVIHNNTSFSISNCIIALLLFIINKKYVEFLCVLHIRFVKFSK